MDFQAFQTMREAGELCDLIVEIGARELHLHSLVIVARSQYFKGLLHSKMKDSNHVILDELPGGYETMSLIADFCYGIDIEESGMLNESNIGHVLCSARYLQMSGTENLEGRCTAKLATLLNEESPWRGLRILDNCSDITIAAQREGIPNQCIMDTVKCLKTNSHRFRDFFDALKDLPISWFVQILETMKVEECSELLMTSMAAFYINSIMTSFNNRYQIQDLLQSSESNLLCRPSLAHSQALLQGFDQVLAYIPDDASTPEGMYEENDPMWFARALEFATTHSLTSTERLFAMCSSVYDKLAEGYDDGNACYNFKPNVFIKLNKLVQANNSGMAESVVKMTDSYLLTQARRRSISVSQFTMVLQSAAWCSRQSFDSAVTALEEMLKVSRDVMEVSDADMAEMIEQVDFTKLSQTLLERAASNRLIPHNVTMTAALRVCAQLRCEMEERDEKIEKISASLAETN